MLADQVVQDLLASGVLARYGNSGQPAGAMLGQLQNNTGESFDGDAILTKIRIALLQTGRVQVITTGGVGVAAEDPIAQRAKERQRLAPGLGNPLEDVPQITIQSKIFRDQVKAQGQLQTAYFLQMKLTDTATGRAVRRRHGVGVAGRAGLGGGVHRSRG